ncbi:MAG: hypothetical protein GF411_08655 [Candidatus Lokiarchaeota archaeon]|nr:hypothetical protein [Candidatus Lokiarchaeota archaeon]
MTIEQYNNLQNHITHANAIKWDTGCPCDNGERWDVVLRDNIVYCDTIMDNFDLHKFVLEVLKIPEDAIVDYWHS